MKRINSILLIAVFFAPMLAAQQATVRQHGKRTLQILRTETPPRIDGILDDPIWKSAIPAADFLQKDPNEGMPATEKTEIRVLYDAQYLYLGAICFDSDISGVRATELRRDNTFSNDDRLSIIIDTFHDHRSAFLFRINPRGTQYDALVTEEGRDVNENWDEKWDVETKINEESWVAEIRIPVKTLRFSSRDSEHDLGIDFERIIRRKNEQAYWNNFDRNFDFNQISQAGHLRGLVEVEASHQLRIKPYLTLRAAHRGKQERVTNYLGDVGLEDLKYAVTPGLTLDLTANTDFAETEVDNQVINFDRVPVFFPEKREFFLEGAGIFEFGVFSGEAASSPEIKLYHTRRIGLSDGGQPIPILAGAKLTGRLAQKFTLGFLQAKTDDYFQRPGDDFTIFRLKRDIFSRSSIGMFITNRQGEKGDFNRVVGIDQNLVLMQYLQIKGMLARSFTDGFSDEQWVGAFGTAWQDDFVNAGFDYSVLERNFQTDVGFLDRGGIGVRKYAPNFRIKPRPHSSVLRQYELGVRVDHFRRIEHNDLEAQVVHLNVNFRFQDGSAIRPAPHRRTENLIRPFRLPGGLVVPPGRYSWWYLPLVYTLNPARKVSGSVEYRHEWNYFGEGGKRQNLSLNPVFKLNSSFSAEVDYSFNRIGMAGKLPVNFHQLNSRFNFALSRKWLTSTLIQYNSTNDLVGVNFRLNYIYRTGDDLFIVFNNFRSGEGFDRQLDRSLVLKLTHSFEF
ncbi:MAG: carbohydrate binding family 9 domain-containing protein [Acidobacteria bacterium]|nr:carbohydrate binding family 9 domain-containing protein [Acidobacteriota bacterium]